MFAFVAFGMARVAAPVSALGLVFDEPLVFALFAAAIALGGALLLLVRAVELRVAKVMAANPRPPSPEESERILGAVGRIRERAGAARGRVIVRVIDVPGPNASAGAGHLLFVTAGALALPQDELEAILAHELGHHRGLHPILTAVLLWLRLPGVALAAVYNALRRGVAALGSSLGSVGRVLAVPLLVLLLVWQVTVMWLFYAGELLAMHAARLSEYEADGYAARLGYGPRLAEAFRRLARHEAEPTGRWARLMAEHPPLADRIDRLDAQSGATARPEGFEQQTPA